jgi:hypothetical protein
MVLQSITGGNIGCCWYRWGVNMPSQGEFDEAQKMMQNLVSGVINTEQYLQALDRKADSIRYQTRD